MSSVLTIQLCVPVDCHFQSYAAVFAQDSGVGKRSAVKGGGVKRIIDLE